MKILALGLAFLFSTAAVAEPIDQTSANKMLYSTKGYSIRLSSKLTPEEQSIVKKLVPLMGEYLRQPVKYYAAIAYSPGDGWVHESIQAAMNYHTTTAASSAALASCNALRSKGKPKCQVAAVVVPKRYRKRDFTLSVDATAAFDKSFKKSKAPKVFAISRSSGSFSIGVLKTNALQACNQASSGANDCEIVIKE